VYPGGVRVLAINPGSTSTKLALLEVDDSGPKVISEASARHQAAPTLQEDLRIRRAFVLERAAAWRPLAAIAARGGLIGPVPAGVFRVDEEMVSLCMRAPFGSHPANLAAPLAYELAQKYGLEAFVVDPPTVDEFTEVSRVSGVAGVPRRSRIHALNLRYVARKAAASVQGNLADTPMVGAHLGGGTSVARFSGGRIVDGNDALLGEGPFSPNRAGTVPVYGAIAKTAELGPQAASELLGRNSGFLGLLGSDDLRLIESMLGEAKTRLVVDAYALQIAKYMASLAAAERPRVFFLTGGGARFAYVVDKVRNSLAWMAPVAVWPGEFEMQALAEGAYRALSGIETPMAVREVTYGNAGL